MRRVIWMAAGICGAVLLTGYLSALSRASSDIAWQELAARVDESCRASSELKDAQIAWHDLDFSNHAAALVIGRWPQAHMNNAEGAVFCLYDKSSEKVETQEFDREIVK